MLNSDKLITDTDNINKYVTDVFNNYKIIISENGQEKECTLDELGVYISMSVDSSEYLNNHTIINLDDLKVEYDTDRLETELNKMNDNRSKYEPARLVKEDSKFIIYDEVECNYVDIGKLSDYIVNNLGEKTIEVNLVDFYAETSEKKVSNSELETELNKFNNCVIKYSNDEQIKASDYIDYFECNNNKIHLVEDDELLKELKKNLTENLKTALSEYNTAGNEIQFNTTNSGFVDVSGGTFGNVVDLTSEAEYIINEFTEMQSEDSREPNYSLKLGNEIGNTYIEVSISEQHVWYYKDDELMLDSDVVTGNLSDGHATPKGIYYISEKVNCKTLRPKGATSGTWVNKWMRLTNDGVGLHDATWRGRFGGNIYKSNGSHGCINLPKDFAYKLYDEVDVYIPVIIY